MTATQILSAVAWLIMSPFFAMALLLIYAFLANAFEIFVLRIQVYRALKRLRRAIESLEPHERAYMETKYPDIFRRRARP